MADLTCPACGAPLTFRASISIYTQCRSCGSTILRTDRDLQLIGKEAALPDEITPLQLGTRFAFRGQRYELLGRQRIAWADGAWNEWFAAAGAETAWLAEAQGFLAVAFEADLPAAPAGTPILGAIVEHAGTRFRVADIKDATCVGSEGELPFAAPRGRKATYVDMISADGRFAGLEIAATERRFYRGAYVAFDQLELANLRPIDGWTPPASPPQNDPFFPR